MSTQMLYLFFVSLKAVNKRKWHTAVIITYSSVILTSVKMFIDHQEKAVKKTFHK